MHFVMAWFSVLPEGRSGGALTNLGSSLSRTYKNSRAQTDSAVFGAGDRTYASASLRV